MSIATIKANIKTILDELVTDTVIAGASVSDIRTDPLSADVSTFPHAFLMPPAVESEVLDNVNIVRTYTFDIVVLFKAENVTGTSEVEEATEDMLMKFDCNPTLGGSSLGGMLPVSSAPVPGQHNSMQLIMVVLQIQAKEVVMLTYV